MSENPFTRPLLDDSTIVPLLRSSRPHRLEVAARSCTPLGRVLLLLDLSWGALLLGFLAVVWLEELGQSVAWVGPWSVQLMGWLAQISPYHVPLIGLACLNVAAVCTGLTHVFTQQSYTLARLGAAAACVPVIGPWGGLAAPLGWMLLARLRRRAVRAAYLG